MRLLAAALCLFFEVGCAALLTGVASRTSRRLGHVNNVNMKLADNGILGVGIIGAGRIGIVHLEALSKCENAKAVIISNPTVSKAEAAANKFKLDAFSGDAMEVINHPDVEAGAPPASGRAGPPAVELTQHARSCRAQSGFARRPSSTPTRSRPVRRRASTSSAVRRACVPHAARALRADRVVCRASCVPQRSRSPLPSRRPSRRSTRATRRACS